MLAFMMMGGSGYEEIAAVAGSCCAGGGSAGSEAGVEAVEGKGEEGSRKRAEGFGADQKPNGSRLSCKEQLGHPLDDQMARFWKASRRRGVRKYTKGANVGGD